MGVKDGRFSLPSDVSNDIGKVLEIAAVQLRSDASTSHALDQKRNAEDVIALADQGLVKVSSQ